MELTSQRVLGRAFLNGLSCETIISTHQQNVSKDLDSWHLLAAEAHQVSRTRRRSSHFGVLVSECGTHYHLSSNLSFDSTVANEKGI